MSMKEIFASGKVADVGSREVSQRYFMLLHQAGKQLSTLMCADDSQR